MTVWENCLNLKASLYCVFIIFKILLYCLKFVFDCVKSISRSEHKKHSPKCQFVKLNKKEADLKIEDLIKLEVKRQESIVVFSLFNKFFQ